MYACHVSAILSSANFTVIGLICTDMPEGKDVVIETNDFALFYLHIVAHQTL